MANPAFDDARASGAGSSGVDSGTEMSGETGGDGSTTDPTDTGDPTDPSTSDSSDSSDTGTSETGVEEMCEFLARPALRMSITPANANACGPTITKQTVLLDVGSLNQPSGMASGNLCADASCQQCTNLVQTVGAPGFTGLADLWATIGALVRLEGIDAVCVEVSATQLIGLIDNTCEYGTMLIVDNSIEHGPVFLGNINDAPLPGFADLALGQLSPPALVPEPLATCSCAGIHPDPAERGCCENSGVEPDVHALGFAGVELAPSSSAKVDVGSVPWRFYAVQAQTVPDCANPTGKPELSWGLVRVD